MNFEPTNFAEALASEYLAVLKATVDSKAVNDTVTMVLDDDDSRDFLELLLSDEFHTAEEDPSEITYPVNTRSVLAGGMMCVVEDGDCYLVLSYVGENQWQPTPWLSPEIMDALRTLPVLFSDDDY